MKGLCHACNSSNVLTTLINGKSICKDCDFDKVMDEIL